MAITASQLPFILSKFNTMFKNGRIFIEGNKTPVTMREVLERQTARVEEMHNKTKGCQEYKIYWTTTQGTESVFQTTAPAIACLIGATETINSDSKSYTKNLYTNPFKFVIPDTFCDNALMFEEELATEIARRMHLIALGLNTEIITRLQAAAMGTFTYTGTGTLVGTSIQYPVSDMTPNLLAEWEDIAIRNYLTGQYLINGMNFSQVWTNAGYQQLDTDKRSLFAMMNGLPMAWDKHNLENVAGGKISFMIDPSMTVFFSEPGYSLTAEQSNDENSTIRYSTPLTYFEADGTPVQAMYRNGNQMVPVYVDIRIQHKCIANGQDGKEALATHVEMMLRGYFGTAPTDDGETGIIQFEFV